MDDAVSKCNDEWKIVLDYYQLLVDDAQINAGYKEIIKRFKEFIVSQKMSDVVERIEFLLKNQHESVWQLVNRFANKVAKVHYKGANSIDKLPAGLLEKNLEDFNKWWSSGDTVCLQSARVAKVIGLEMRLRDTAFFTNFHSFLSNMLELVLSSEVPNRRLNSNERLQLENMKAAVDSMRHSWMNRREWVVLFVFFLVVAALVAMSVLFGWTKPESDDGNDSDDDDVERQDGKRRKSAIRKKY